MKIFSLAAWRCLWLLLSISSRRGGTYAASLQPTQEKQDIPSSSSYDEVVDAIVDALTDATEPLNSAYQSHPPIATKKRLQRWAKRVQNVLLTPLQHYYGSPKSKGGGDASTTAVPPCEDTKTKKPKETPKKQKSPHKRPYRAAFEAFRFSNKADMEETIAGARLLSGSFHLLSTTAGFVADSVRVSGDTAAGLMGSSVKVVGTAIKSFGGGLTSASRLLETKSTNVTERKSEEEEKNESKSDIRGEQQPAGGAPEQPKKRPFAKRTRQVAAKSVRFMGAVIDGVGESLLIAGVAAESLTSSTVGVAAETVRVVEDLAGTVSLAISLRGRQKRKKRQQATGDFNETTWRRRITPPFLSFGTYDTGSSNTSRPEEDRATLLEQLKIRFLQEPTVECAMELMKHLAADAAKFGQDVSADVEGVPSMASELAAAFVLCFLMTLLLRPTKKVITRNNNDVSNNTRQRTQQADSQSDEDRSTTLEYCFRFRVVCRNTQENDFSALQICCHCLQIIGHGLKCCCTYLCKLPFVVLKLACRSLLGFVFSRKMVLLCFYGLVCVYLSRLSQQRALLLQRRAEAIGYRNGIASITDAALPSPETLLWLNHVMGNLWRVRHTHDATHGDYRHHYPSFVARELPEDGEMYGGLEPYLASNIGSAIVNSLEITKAMRPTDIAYVSLYSLSLGRRPPMIRSVALANEIVAKGDKTQIELDLEIDAFLEDLSMVLEVKLSSLSYSLLPSTKIKIFNVDFRASLKVILVLGPQYPFVSMVQLSMMQQPHCDLRITPVSKDSSLNGVDLSSIPFLNDWIRDAIRTALSIYVSPRYITIDVVELLRGGDKPDMTSMVPNLETSLRRRTRTPVSTPRTSTPDGIAITSVADKLESHHSSMQAVGTQATETDERRKAGTKKKTILKPVTELSRLALDRHALKESNLVRPVTELARLGMDRWLDSTVMMKRSVDEGERVPGK